MSLARTALRLLVTGTLTGSVSSRPTIAQGRVYDSRLSDIDPNTFSEDAKPTIIVLTDDDEGDALSDQSGGPPFRRRIDVVLECGMVCRVKEGDDSVVGSPDTDARLEASIDLLEFQALQALSSNLDPLPTLFRRLVRIWKHAGHRHTDEQSPKVACRILSLTCEISDDRVTIYNDAATPLPTGLDVLPEPLRTIAHALPVGSAGADTVAALAAALAPIEAPALEGLDVTVDAADTTNTPGDDRQVDGTIELDQP
jgi:hypothetical protein